MLIALTRGVSGALARCELTHLAREPIDLERARAQHAEYEAALGRLGACVRRIAGNDSLPDSVFIEDTAVVLDELAVIMRPGAASRRGEVEAVAATLREFRPLAWMREPGTMDGGDVLRVGRTLYVGLSSRTNAAGVEQLRKAVAPFGYAVQGVEVGGCLHLKSAVTEVGEGVLLGNAAWVSPAVFGGAEWIDVDAREVYAANAVRVGGAWGAVIYPEHFPRTAERLERRGIRVERVPCDELAKAEGAVTCCSILLETHDTPQN
jgi:dimethylargininase